MPGTEQMKWKMTTPPGRIRDFAHFRQEVASRNSTYVNPDNTFDTDGLTHDMSRLLNTLVRKGALKNLSWFRLAVAVYCRYTFEEYYPESHRAAFDSNFLSIKRRLGYSEPFIVQEPLGEELEIIWAQIVE